MLRKLVLRMWVAAGLAVLNLVWIAAVRHYQNEAAEHAAKARRMRFYGAPAEHRRPGMRILRFYAAAGNFEKSDAVLVHHARRGAHGPGWYVQSESAAA